MPSDPARARIDWSRRTEPADLPEWMDEPASYEQMRACLHNLDQVTRLTFGYRPTLTFLARLLKTSRLPNGSQPRSTLHILDVGCGGGDALHCIARWSRARGIPVKLTGIDLNPLAISTAKERYGHAEIEWLCGDAMSYTGVADIILSSLLTHHLATADVVRFIRWMEETSTLGWFVNDLQRSASSASLFALLARVMRWHPFVRHDGPVSFARSFGPGDWRRILSQAGLPPGQAQVTPAFPARLCVSRFK